jgi:hypothetical protein
MDSLHQRNHIPDGSGKGPIGDARRDPAALASGKAPLGDARREASDPAALAPGTPAKQITSEL